MEKNNNPTKTSLVDKRKVIEMNRVAITRVMKASVEIMESHKKDLEYLKDK